MKYKCDGCGSPTDNIYHDSDFMDEAFIKKYGDREHHRCADCDKRLEDEIEWENEQAYTEHITCPWCGYENLDSWEYEDSEDEVECGECSRMFDLDVHHDIKYTTRKSECEREEEQP